MRARGQLLAAVVVLAVVLGAAFWAPRALGPRALASGPRAAAPSGAWFCPHGGGKEWTVELEIANPGSSAVPIRIRGLSAGKPGAPADALVQPGSTLTFPVSGARRESSSMVEYFGGWVAVSWVAHAGGGEIGTAAEPCAASAGGRWFLPEASTLEGDDPYVVVMNPFAGDAIFSLTLFTDRHAPIRTEEWTDVVLKSFRSATFRLNEKALGYGAVSVLLEASVGRVAAADLDLAKGGGARASLGYLGSPPPTQILPGGADAGRTDLVVMTSGTQRVDLSGDLLEHALTQPVAGLADASPPGESARTFPVTTEGASTIVFHAGAGVAAARRTFGVGSDQASTIGAATAAADWVVLPAVAGHPNRPGLVLANPGSSSVTVTLTFLAGASSTAPEPVTLTIPPAGTSAAPKDWIAAAPRSAVLATATAGTFVPAAASYSLGLEGVATYAVALGVPIPARWVPQAP